MTLTPDEFASRDALAREVGSGSLMALMPVRQAESGNRVLEATRELLHDNGFLVVVLQGGSDDAVQAAWSLIASARLEASKKGALRRTVLIVKDAHLLPSGRLDLLAQAGDVAIVAAPVTRRAALRKKAWLRRLRIASILAVPVLASLAIGTFLWPVVQRAMLRDEAAPTETAAAAGTSIPPPETPAPDLPAIEPTPPARAEAPGLLIKAKPGDTLEILYHRVYRGLTPPPFASVAALNPEPVRPGDILTFPEPENGWGRSDSSETR